MSVNVVRSPQAEPPKAPFQSPKPRKFSSSPAPNVAMPDISSQLGTSVPKAVSAMEQSVTINPDLDVSRNVQAVANDFHDFSL